MSPSPAHLATQLGVCNGGTVDEFRRYPPKVIVLPGGTPLTFWDLGTRIVPGPRSHVSDLSAPNQLTVSMPRTGAASVGMPLPRNRGHAAGKEGSIMKWKAFKWG